MSLHGFSWGKMKSLAVPIILAIALSSTAVQGLRCYQCIENSWERCNAKQANETCSNSLYTHCFAAYGTYNDGGQLKIGTAKGCIPCSSETLACNFLKLALKRKLNGELKTCHIDCCQGDFCNYEDKYPSNATTTSLPTSASPGGNRTKDVTSSSSFATTSRGVVALFFLVMFLNY